MGSIIGQTDIAQIGQGNQVAGDDARLAQFRDGVYLAAAQNAVAQVHVGIFVFAAIPTG